MRGVTDSPPPIERHLRVHRTARFYQLGTASSRIKELWIACHGYGQLAEPFARALSALDDGTRVVVAPEALSRFYRDEVARPHTHSPIGASWMTREDRGHEITDYVEYLDSVTSTVRREIGVQSIRVTVLGFSQGVATACRWTALGHTEIARLILWAGPFPEDLPTDRGNALFRGASLTVVAGTRDSVITPKVVDRNRDAMEALGLHADFMSFDGGHSLDSATLRRIAQLQ